MDSNEYKRNKENSAVFDYSTLITTVKCLQENGYLALAERITSILVKGNIEKPLLHTKPEDKYTNYYYVDLSFDDVKSIVWMFSDLEVGTLGNGYQDTQEASFYASMLDRWNKLITD